MLDSDVVGREDPTNGLSIQTGLQRSTSNTNLAQSTRGSHGSVLSRVRSVQSASTMRQSTVRGREASTTERTTRPQHTPQRELISSSSDDPHGLSPVTMGRPNQRAARQMSRTSMADRQRYRSFERVEKDPMAAMQARMDRLEHENRAMRQAAINASPSGYSPFVRANTRLHVQTAAVNTTRRPHTEMPDPQLGVDVEIEIQPTSASQPRHVTLPPPSMTPKPGTISVFLGPRRRCG
jgi:hypothetical protein